MKLSISNIAWSAEYDEEMYSYLSESGFSGIEIAPTRIFPENPYDAIDAAVEFRNYLKKSYGLEISSLQSICYGRNEVVFGTAKERKSLFEYVQKAIDFAHILECKNLVFGSPKNRIIGENQLEIAEDFFGGLGEYAQSKNTVLALEPNPVIYGTNFMNTTKETIDFVRAINSDGLKVNLDLGTYLYNQENMEMVQAAVINHIHISEPYLEEIETRSVHQELAGKLREIHYDKYISIEMKNLNAPEQVKKTLHYIKDIFYAS